MWGCDRARLEAWSVFTVQFQRQEILLASYPHSTLDISLSLSRSVCTVVDGRQSASFLVSGQLIIHQLHCDTANFTHPLFSGAPY